MSFAGRLVYQLWHRPYASVRYSIRHGGPLAQFATYRGRLQMEAATATLPPLPDHAGSSVADFSVHLLTGHRFVHQTVFCLHSLGRHSPVALAPEFYDDGSLTPADFALLRRLSPRVIVHDHATLRARLDQFLPLSKFPTLRERWVNYPHIRKLIDVHLGRTGSRLVLDSDLLFWREPRFLLDWAAAPDRPLHAVDCEENYGYSRPLLEKIAGRPLPALVNVGICGLRSESIDWDFLEHAASTLIAAERTSYFLEQALVALLVTRAGTAAVADVHDYLIYPSLAEIARPTAVMHHYVDTTRGPYYRQAWRMALASR